MSNKLLLIEDDSFMREMITMVLETSGYEVYSAVDGVQAKSLLAEQTAYAAVISDLYLPDTDALALFAGKEGQLKQDGQRLIILTSETDEKLVKKATELGLIYIYKDENFAETLLAALT